MEQSEAKPKKQIYLAGPIKGCSQEQRDAWRTFCKKHLKDLYVLHDPVEFEADIKNHKHLVEQDLRYIKAADIILVHLWKHSVGTSMEMVYAHQYGKEILVVTYDDGPWLMYHMTQRFSKLEDAIQHLKERA
jgi:nucleoside 2-deoxyribosyltransferase